MATIKVINGESVRVNETEKGAMYSKSFRSLKEECAALGTCDARVNMQKHSLFLGGNSYYVGPSLQGKSASELAALGKEIQVCDSITEKSYKEQVAANDQRIANGETPKAINWVPCLFLPTQGESVSFSF